MSTGVRVLVVDDDDVMRQTFADFLQRRGYGVGTASDGSEALGMLDADRWDVVLLDMTMPGMDGMAVLERVMADDRPRADGSAAHQPRVIMLTAISDAETVDRAMRAGASGYLVKPCKLATIDQSITACLA